MVNIIWFLGMFCVVFWIGVYISYKFLFYIIVISCKSSVLVIGVSSWFFWVSVIIGLIKLVLGIEV